MYHLLQSSSRIITKLGFLMPGICSKVTSSFILPPLAYGPNEEPESKKMTRNEMTTFDTSFVFQAHVLAQPSPNWAGIWTNTSLCIHINEMFLSWSSSFSRG